MLGNIIVLVSCLVSAAPALAGNGPLGGTISLATLGADGNGFKILNHYSLDEAGISIAGIDDLDADGRDDVLIGAKYHGAAGIEAGAAYLVSGKTSGDSVDLSLVGLGQGGFKITGEAAGDHTGYAVSRVGDLNKDGIPDLLIGGRYNDGSGKDAGAAYLVWGKQSGSEVNLDDVAAGRGGYKIVGQNRLDFAGHSVSDVGDANRDGIPDLLVGAHYNDAGGGASGAAYFVYGKASGGLIDLDNVAAGVGGFRIVGQAAADHAGWAVAQVDDMNGDGIAEIAVSAPNNDAGGNNAGAVYVVFGKATASEVRLASLGTAGFRIVGERAGDTAGWSIASASDMNGDGKGDLVVGAKTNDGNGRGAGAVYVVWGKADSTEVNLDNVAAGRGGFKIIGQAPGDYAGWSVAGVGDLNGNGVPDLLIGAVRQDGAATDAGAAYVVYGKATTTAVRLTNVAAGTGGFRILGEASGDHAGTSVAAGGDVNGDGRRDLLIGARFNDAGGIDAGAGYVVFGAASWQGDS